MAYNYNNNYNNNNMVPCFTGPCMTTKWPWGPYMTSPPWNDQGGGGGPGDQGVMYLWSPLAIFCVALGLLLALILIIVLAVMIYNYCTYGMCCCPGSGGCAGSDSMCCMGPMCCPMQQPEKTVVVSRRRGSCDSRSSGGSVRGRRPRQQIVVDDGRSDCDSDSVVVVSRPNIDRKMVRIADSPEVHTIKVRRPVSQMSMSPQQQPIILQPQIFVQPSTIQPIAPSCPPPQQRCAPQSSFQGGELKVVIGNGYQQRSSNSSSKPLVFNMARNQPNEYVLTPVDGGMQSGGGFNISMQSGGGFNSGMQSGGGFNSGMQSGGGCNAGMQSGGGFYGGDSKGCGYQDDRASSFSDGQRSAIIDIGHGVRNSFYPSLPQYDD